MNILLTNDDGVYAPGIYAAYRALKSFARVTVVAPDYECSAVGHGITLAHPIWYKKVQRQQQFFGYGISGTPADCVKFGIDVILKRKPDMVVSGINLGDNDGCSVFYSGTVAGAREGALLGIPAIAVSLATFQDADFSVASSFLAKLVKYVERHGLPKGSFLNVNVPAGTSDKIKGLKVTQQGMTPIHARFHRRVDPHKREYFWMSGKSPTRQKNTTIDTHALRQGYVTVTPIHCDLTDYETLAAMKTWPALE